MVAYYDKCCEYYKGIQVLEIVDPKLKYCSSGKKASAKCTGGGAIEDRSRNGRLWRSSGNSREFIERLCLGGRRRSFAEGRGRPPLNDPFR